MGLQWSLESKLCGSLAWMQTLTVVKIEVSVVYWYLLIYCQVDWDELLDNKYTRDFC